MNTYSLKKICLIISLFLLTTSCTPTNNSQQQNPTQTIPAATTPTMALNSFFDLIFEEKLQYPEWKAITSTIAIKELPITQNSKRIDVVVVVKLSPEQAEISILQDTQKPLFVDEWREQSGAQVVINGNYFQENYHTAGFLKTNGNVFGEIRSPYDGIFLVANGKAEVRYLKEKPVKNTATIEFGITNFPMLIANGKNLLSGKATEQQRRTAIAQTSEGMLLLIVTKRMSLTLAGLTDFLVHSDLSITNALNLDGGASTGLSIKTTDFDYNIPSFDQVPNVIVINEQS
ncbi:MAG: phosphodiester glycosidase family protein [bacterium]